MTGPDVNAEGHALKVFVTAVPEDGKANAAVIKLLAKRWRVAPGRFSVVSGVKARRKVVEIEGGDQELLDKIMKIEETVS